MILVIPTRGLIYGMQDVLTWDPLKDANDIVEREACFPAFIDPSDDVHENVHV